MRPTHCVIRVFPAAVFFEESGMKEYSMAYAKRTAKPRLKVSKAVSVMGE
jgi:hypothetical protein